MGSLTGIKRTIEQVLAALACKDHETMRESRLHDIQKGFRKVDQPAVSDSLHGFRKNRGLRLVAFIRTGHESLASDQEQKIKDYCRERGHIIVAVFGGGGQNAVDLQEALAALYHSDGLIAVDLMRLFCHDKDPVRELQHEIHRHFFHDQKRLITIEDGIDTGTAEGQVKVVQFLGTLCDESRAPSEGLHTIANSGIKNETRGDTIPFWTEC